MKIKRIVLMLTLVLVVAAIPLVGDVLQVQDTDGYADLTFDTYGYGAIRATRNNNTLQSGMRLPIGTEINFLATEVSSDHSHTGWRINGVPYRGAPSLTHTLVLEQDTHVRAVFYHPWAATGTPVPESYVLISSLHVDNDDNGNILITSPGVSGLSINNRSTAQTVEFTVTPPAGRFFNDSTTLYVAPDLTRTFGPTVHANGTLSFTLLSPVLHIDDPTPTPTPNPDTTPNPTPTPFPDPHVTATPAPTVTPEPAQVVIAFDAGQGSFVDGETGMRLMRYGDVLTHTDLPAAPTRSGHRFVHWRLPDGSTLERDINITGDLLIRAVWSVNQTTTPTPGPTATPGPSSSSSSSTPGPSSSSSSGPGPSSSSSSGPGPSSSSGSNPGPSSSSNSAPRPNPQTSPMQISFAVLGVVVAGGMAAFGIVSLNRKQKAMSDKYRTNEARFNREKRLMDMLDKD